MYMAAAPSSSSIRSSWLYLARRSERQGAPVLIWWGGEGGEVSEWLSKEVSRWVVGREVSRY